MMRKSRRIRDKIISLVLIMTVVFTMFPAGITQVYAEEISANADKIIDINDLSTDIEESNRDEFDGATITGTDLRMQEPITIKADNISLTIENLDVNASFNGIVIAKGNTLRLTVKGTNTIKAGEGYTGIHLKEGASLIITEESTGTLNVQGGPLASIGIGGIENFNLIQIDGGTINASGTRANIGGFYLGGAGIGSGCVGNDSKIIINGGVVNATGYSNCAGIGGNSGVEISEIIINGGVVTATTANSQVAAAIGAGGTQSAVDKITINGGTVIANGSIGGGSDSEPNNTILTVSDKAVVSASSISSVGSTNAVQHTANVSIHDMKLTENKRVTVNYSIDGSSFSGTTTGTLNVSNYCGTITLPKFIRPDTNTGKTLKVTVSDGTNTWSGSAPLAKTTNVVVGNKFHLGKLVFVSEKIVEDISNYQITIKKNGVTLQKGKDFEIGNIKLAEIYKGVASLWIPAGTYDVTVKTSALNNNANMTGKLIVTDGGSNQLLLLNEVVSEVPSALYLDQGNIEFGLQDGISYVSYYDNGTQKKINGVPSEAEILVTQKSSAATSNQLVIKDGSFSIRLKNINVLNTDTDTATRKPLFDIGGNGNIFFTIEGTNTITGGTFHPIINAPSASLAFRGTGNFTVKSNESASYAAIKAKNVTIEGVTLTAIGGNSTSDRCHGIWGSETVTINSGTVNASTGRDSGISGAVITINGGTVTATGGSTGAGIGGSGSRININGGIITAKGGSDSSGIGSNSYGGTTEINISGGMVSATSGNDRASAIGAGNKAGMATITISGGTVIAQRGAENWGNTIGRSSSSGSAVVTITGGTIKTPSITNPKNGAGESLSCITYTLDGASEGTLVTSGSKSEYGINDVRTMDTDKLYFYLPSGILPSGTVPATITTKEKEYICLNDQTYLTQHVELEAATCTYAEVCKVCGGENGSALGHNYMDGYCTRCNIDTKGCVHILTAEQLIRFAKDVNKGNRIADAVLEADIDLSGYQWETICETGLYNNGYGEDLGYAGTFDGNGHVIKNVKVKSSTTMDASCGLFGTVSGTIKKLGIEGFTFVDGGKDIRTGAIVGQLITANGRVENCYVKNATIKPGEHVTGGIAGCVYDGTIENCYVVESDINGTANRYGYIVGDSRGDGGASDRPGTVNNCYTDHSTIRSNNVGNVTNCATKSAEAFASGEVTYLLNVSKSDGDLVWYQTIEEDASPQYSGMVVYYDEMSGYQNHIHDWTYEKDGDNKIIAVCYVDGCYAPDGGSVTITAPENPVYDQTAKAATYESTGNFEGETYTIIYKDAEGREVQDALVNAGTYTAELTAHDCTAELEFTIEKAEVTIENVHLYDSKPYDGTAIFTELDEVNIAGVLEGDEVTVASVEGSVASADVGLYHELTVTAIELTGKDADNYQIKLPAVANVVDHMGNNGALGISPLFLTVIAKDQTVSLNGELDQTQWELTDGSLIEGQKLEVTLLADTSEQTDFGVIELEVKVLDAEGNDVTDNYIIHQMDGSLTVGCADHTEFTNGFCNSCDGYQAPALDDNGTEDSWDDQYLIENAGQLFWIANYIHNVTNEVNVKVLKDITIPEGKEWTPLMNFYGTFDGNYQTISGMHVQSEGNEVGMFGGGGYFYGTVKNLHLSDSYFEGNDYVGGIAGYFGGTMENCYVDDTVIVKGQNFSAALVGNNTGTILNSYAYAEKLVGYNSGTIENSYYLAAEDDGNGGKTAAQFESGEVAYLLQAGQQGETEWDDELQDYVEVAPAPQIWGQNIDLPSKDAEEYPTFDGAKVYFGYVGCKAEEMSYSNYEVDEEQGKHIYEAGKCIVCQEKDPNAVPESKPEVCKVFSDVNHGAWYEEAVQYVYDNGIMSGNNGLFKPTGNITRAQVVTTLYNLEGKPEVTDYSAVYKFGDVEEGKWYTDAVCWAYNKGITTGNSSTMMFNMNDNVTRQQLATFFYRYAEFKGLDITTRGDYSDLAGADQVASYAAETMKWAYGTGLITGSKTTVNGATVYELKPTGTATRAQMAAILQRFCENAVK